MELLIFNTYGVGDQPAEFDETNLTMLLIVKDEEINALKNQVLFLKNQSKKAGQGAVLQSAEDSWNS